MKKLFFSIVMVLALCMNSSSACAQEFTQNGNTFSAVAKSGSRKGSEPEKTSYQWEDSKGVKYDIYISSTGSVFVYKTSKKTGKQYKNYLGPEISQKICNLMGRKYTSKSTKSDKK